MFNRSKLSDFTHQRIGLTLQDIITYHLDNEGVPPNAETLRKGILPQLENAGLIIWDKPTNENADKRSRHIFPQSFTSGEQEMLDHVAKGKTNAEISAHISELVDRGDYLEI